MHIHKRTSLVLLILVLFSGCTTNSELTVANFYQPPSSILRYRDIHQMNIQVPEINISDVIDDRYQQLYQQTIQEMIVTSLMNQPWYPVSIMDSDSTATIAVNEKMNRNGYHWQKQVAWVNHHKIFTSVKLLDYVKNQKKCQMKATLFIIILDPDDEDVYMKIFENLSASDHLTGNESDLEVLSLHRRLAHGLFHDAISEFAGDILPKSNQQVIHLHNKSDIRGRYLISASAFPEALVHLEASIQKKERKKNRDSEQNQRLTGDYTNYGIALEAMGFLNQAMISYKKAIKVDPNNNLAKHAIQRLTHFQSIPIQKRDTKSLRSQND